MIEVLSEIEQSPAELLIILRIFARAFSHGNLDLWPLDLELSQHFWCHAFKLYTKFKRNRVIPGWIIDNFAKFCICYLTLWPWPLTSWPWTLGHFECHAFKLCTKFEHNQIIRGWDIDEHVFACSFRGWAELIELSQRCVYPTSPNLARTWGGHRSIALLF